MPDGLLPRPDTRKAALAELAERGAHFVRMKLLSNGDKKAIAESAGYTERSATLKQVLLHNRAKQLVAVVPASLRCVVVDVDDGGEAVCDEVVRLLGRPVARVMTQRENGWHLWYRSRDAHEIGNRAWRHGDIRGAKGQAILWAPELVAEGLACAGPVADLMAVDLDQLPSKRDGAAVGERNNTLNKGVYLATRNGQPIDEAVAAAREAGLPEREIAATVESAVTAGKRKGARTLVPSARTPEGLIYCLDSLGIGLRLNTRAKRYEYFLDGAWRVADDERDAWLRGTIAKNFRPGAAPTRRCRSNTAPRCSSTCGAPLATTCGATRSATGSKHCHPGTASRASTGCWATCSGPRMGR